MFYPINARAIVRLAKKSEQRNGMLRRMLGLVKTLLAVPDATEAFKTGNSLGQADLGRTTHVIRAMKETRLLEFLMTAAGSVELPMFRSHAVTLCEIFSLVFSAYSPTRKGSPVMEVEKRATKPTRHSNFSGSIIFKLSTGQDYVLRQGSYFNGCPDLDRGKKERRPGGRKAAPLSYNQYGSKSCSTADALLGRQFADSFISSCFNVLVRHLGAEEMDGRLNDDRFHRSFLRLLSWFLQYIRSPTDEVSGSGPSDLRSVYAALDVDVLLGYARLMRRFHEEAKKNGDLLLTAVVFFRDVLRTVELLASTDSSTEAIHAAKDIQNALFYQMDLLTALIIQRISCTPIHLKTSYSLTRH